MYTYTRTEKAIAEIRSATGALPRKLRGILAVVDSKTRHSTYVNMLSNFGDVEMLLEMLVDEGYLKRHGVDNEIGHNEVKLYTQATSARPVYETMPLPRIQATAKESMVLSSSNFLIEKTTGLLNALGGQTYQSKSNNSADKKAAESAFVREVLNKMNDFISVKMPNEAVEIMLILEQITQLKELKNTLNNYEELVLTLGEAGKSHVRHIRTIIASYTEN